MRELAIRSRWAAPAGCSVVVHGGGAILLLVLAHRTMLAAPFDPVSVALVVEATLDPAPAAAPAPAEASPAAAPAPRHSSARRKVAARAELVHADPEPPLAEPEPEPRLEPEAETSAPPLGSPVTPPPLVLTPPAPAAVEPALDPDAARALRVYDAFPSLHEQAARTLPDLDVKVCVSTQGAVSDAVIVRGPTDPASETLRAAILRWRYRPFTPDGTPTPFCHLMRISYRMN